MQNNKIDNIRDSLAMNITMLSNTLAGQPQSGTAVLRGINVFEGCTTSIESNCTIQPATIPGGSPPCITDPEVPLNQVRSTSTCVMGTRLMCYLILVE